MAHKKLGGSTKNTRDSKPKYLGVKKADGSAVIPGNVLVRQRGSKIMPGKNVGIGNDHTLFALTAGTVRFFERRKRDFTNSIRRKKVVTIDTK